jgi:hypothetical protein
LEAVTRTAICGTEVLVRHCVSCDTSWDRDPPRCPSCGRRTLDDHEILEWRAKQTERSDARLVSVKVLEGPADEAFVRAMLDEAGFDFQIVTHQDDAFGSLVAGSRGYGAVMVPEPDADAVKQLLQEAMAAEPIAEEPV